MPKIVDYPRAGLRRVLGLATALESLGGEASLSAAAERFGHRPGGAFTALLGAGAKYGLLSTRAGRVTLEPVWREYRLAYDDAGRRAVLRRLALSPPLFRRVLARFAERALPLDYLPKVLIREFGVPDALAPRVAGYLVEAARDAGLLDGDRVTLAVRGDGSGVESASDLAATRDAPVPVRAADDGDAPLGSGWPLSVGRRVRASVANAAVRSDAPARPSPPGAAPAGRASRYRVHISGPDLESTVDLGDAGDLELVWVMLKTVERRLRHGVPTPD